MAYVNPVGVQPNDKELVALVEQSYQQRRLQANEAIENSRVDIPIYNAVDNPSVFPDVIDKPPSQSDILRLRRMVKASYNDSPATFDPTKTSAPHRSDNAKQRASSSWIYAMDVRKWPSMAKATIADLSNLDEVEGASTREKIKKCVSDYRWVPFFVAWLILLAVLCLLRYGSFF